jgi:peptidoglycan hydrolase-like protein with peptidoglycan-binding domain
VVAVVALLAGACAGSQGAALTEGAPGGINPDDLLPLVAEPPPTTVRPLPQVSLPPTTLAAPTPAARTPAGPTPVATTAPLRPGLGPGDQDVSVLGLEERLVALGYDVGTLDNLFDGDTAQAVLAFQKVTGLERTGRATEETVAALNATTGRPAPLVPGGGYRRVEVDLDRQVLFLYEGDQLAVILNASTGSGERFCSEGWCRRAVTPTGSYTVSEQRRGWEHGPLGWLYNSQYFNGGIAIHGSTSVPAHPASHGCVRISMSAAEWFPSRVSVGTPVYVVAAGEPVPTPIGGLPVTAPPTTVA